MVSFPKRYQSYQVGTPPPSGQSRHHLLPLVVPYPSTTHRGFFTFPTSHSDSLHSYLMVGLFVSQPPFLFQVWPDLEWNQDSADRPGELLRPLTRSCFLLLVLGRLFLLALPFLLGICLRSRWNPPFSLHALALIPLTLAKVRLSPILTLSPSWSGTLVRRLCSFCFWQGRLRRFSQLFSLWHWGHSYVPFGRPSMFKFFR